MQIRTRRVVGMIAVLLLIGPLSATGVHQTAVQGASARRAAAAVPPGAPPEDITYAIEWPAPNADEYNTRVAHATITSKNVSKLGVAYTVPITGTGQYGSFFANPLAANGVTYLQDGASNVIAVNTRTGKRLWEHVFHSGTLGPNGVTIANGKIYGMSTTTVFALAAATGKTVWARTFVKGKSARGP
jgi:outer membrane protein assembly factor BamB